MGAMNNGVTGLTQQGWHVMGTGDFTPMLGTEQCYSDSLRPCSSPFTHMRGHTSASAIVFDPHRSCSWTIALTDEPGSLASLAVPPNMVILSSPAVAVWMFRPSSDTALLLDLYARVNAMVAPGMWSPDPVAVHVANPDAPEGPVVLRLGAGDGDRTAESLRDSLPEAPASPEGVVVLPVERDAGHEMRLTALADRMSLGVNHGPLPADSLGLLSMRSTIPEVGAGKDGLARFRQSKTSIARWSHWSMETSRLTSPWVAVDLDDSDSVDRILASGLPSPSFIIRKRRTGHAQAFWLINPVRRRDDRAFSFYRAVSRNLTSALGGDPEFVSHRVQNPYWAGMADIDADVLVPSPTTMWHSLTGLYHALRDAGLWSSSSRRRPLAGVRCSTSTNGREWNMEAIREYIGGDAVVPEGSRNATLFSMATWMRWHGYEPSIIRQVHVAGGMSDREVTGIIVSVNKYYQSMFDGKWHPERGSAELAELGRRGGRANTVKQGSARRSNLDAGRGIAVSASTDLRRRVYAATIAHPGVTRAELSRIAGVSRPTLYKHLHAIHEMIRDMVNHKGDDGAVRAWFDFVNKSLRYVDLPEFHASRGGRTVHVTDSGVTIIQWGGKQRSRRRVDKC